jgi:ribosomal-protein-alanine N-acetyltransferase
MRFTFRPMDEVSAHAILNWRYDAPYDLYNPASGEVEEGVRNFLALHNAYHTIADVHGDLVAYCCFGPDAQVPGGDYGADALDIGMGMHPKLTGQGRGLGIITAVLDFAQRTYAPRAFRATIAAFNQRALHVCEKAGFRPVQTFQRDQDARAFVVLMRELRALHVTEH